MTTRLVIKSLHALVVRTMTDPAKPIPPPLSSSIPLLRKPRPPSDAFLSKSHSHHPSSSRESRPPVPPPTVDYAREYADLLPWIDNPALDEPLLPAPFLILPLYPKGPSFLPARKILRSSYSSSLPPEEKKEDRPNEQSFTLNDFLKTAEPNTRVAVRSALQRAFIPRESYAKITSLFASKQQQVNRVDIEVEQLATENRKPQHQISVELQAMLNEALAETRSILSADDSKEEDHWPSPRRGDFLFHSTRARYFCGEGRSNSPFDSAHQPFISPEEVAILHSIMEGGTSLSLKAHFLQHLPDLSPLTLTLTSLNLSFNDFRVFPSQILLLQELVSLKMRNNPIRQIPSAIRKLRKLEVFSIPFNLLTDLPSGLFDLCNLRKLNISHNSLQWLSKDIAKLRRLECLHIEHNQLAGFPSSFITLPLLSRLSVDGNLMHPLLWKENAQNQPQALVDLCCVAIARVINHEDISLLPAEAQPLLRSGEGVCDSCGGSLYGSGIRLIRATREEQFGVKLLPLIFTVCSPLCRNKLKRSNTVA